MDKVFGIDISYYQAGMDLAQAKSEGVKFAILRAGYTGYGNGVSKAKDTAFETHYKNAKSNGLGVGAYWYSRATTYENGKLVFRSPGHGFSLHGFETLRSIRTNADGCCSFQSLLE